MNLVRFPVINTGGHTLTIDSGGIEVGHSTHAATLYGGNVTSSESFLDIRLSQSGDLYPNGNLYINSVIRDSGHSIGVRAAGKGGLVFEGNQSNTFTGNVEVTGALTSLYLNKSDAAVAVKNNIFINEGLVAFYKDQQVSNTSSITLKNNAKFGYNALWDHSIENTFKNLIIENGGVINFIHTATNDTLNSKYYIYLDDLIINSGGILTVKDWQHERDHLLVRKDSQNLTDALGRMEFEGYNSANIHLRDWNSDYWEISALPEPSTYGAILGATGLGLWAWRKRRRRG